MRSILFIAALLFALGWIACEVDSTRGGRESPEPVVWVRTRDGWEKTSDWRIDAPATPYQPLLHPLPVAAGILLLSTAALLGIRAPGED